MFKNFGNDTKERNEMVIVYLALIIRLEHWYNNMSSGSKVSDGTQVAAQYLKILGLIMSIPIALLESGLKHFCFIFIYFFII